MKKLIILTAVLALAACGKKKAPAAPANAAEPAAAETAPATEQNVNTPADKDDAKKMGSDPCEGGE